MGMYGTYHHKLDAKGRLSLPSVIRKALPEDAHLVIVPDTRGQFLTVYTEEGFDEWVDTLFEKRGGYDPNNRDHVMLYSALHGLGEPAAIDGAGRIGLSADQRAAIGLDKDAVVVGNGSNFQVWSEEGRNALFATIDLDALLYTSGA